MDDGLAPYSVPKGSETILVAEDDDVLRTLLQVALESCGYRVLASASGPAALQLAERHGELIALLVSDVTMPGMEGPELARRLAASRPALKVLLLSGYDLDPAFLDAGVGFLQKPFRPSALVARVREILDFAPASTRSPPPRRARKAPAGEQPPCSAECGAEDLHLVEACGVA